MPNNFFGDIMFKMLVDECLVNLPKLRELDVSCNKLTDSGLQELMERVVKKHTTLAKLEINFNKMLDEKTAVSISEALQLCPNL